MRPRDPDRPLSPASRPRANSHERSVAIVKPYTLRFSSFDGVAGMESVMIEYHSASAFHSNSEPSKRFMGVMTEPTN